MSLLFQATDEERRDIARFDKAFLEFLNEHPSSKSYSLAKMMQNRSNILWNNGYLAGMRVTEGLHPEVHSALIEKFAKNHDHLEPFDEETVERLRKL